MTSNEVITIIRNRLNKLNPTQSFQDKDLWREFTMARSRVLKNQLSKRNTISNLAYHKFCIELEDAPTNECSCLQSNSCKAKKSKYQLPSYLHTSSNSTLKVMNVDNKLIDLVDHEYVEDNLLYMPGYKDKQIASISNAYLYVYNSEAEFLQVQAIWSNPLDILWAQYCKTSECIQDDKELIQISEELLLDMINITISSLAPAISIPSDDTSNNNEKY